MFDKLTLDPIEVQPRSVGNSVAISYFVKRGLLITPTKLVLKGNQN